MQIVRRLSVRVQRGFLLACDVFVSTLFVGVGLLLFLCAAVVLVVGVGLVDGRTAVTWADACGSAFGLLYIGACAVRVGVRA